MILNRISECLAMSRTDLNYAPLAFCSELDVRREHFDSLVALAFRRKKVRCGCAFCMTNADSLFTLFVKEFAVECRSVQTCL